MVVRRESSLLILTSLITFVSRLFGYIDAFREPIPPTSFEVPTYIPQDFVGGYPIKYFLLGENIRCAPRRPDSLNNFSDFETNVLKSQDLTSSQ